MNGFELFVALATTFLARGGWVLVVAGVASMVVAHRQEQAKNNR